jgi:tetratricopeptide (TPR) repeat protein
MFDFAANRGRGEVRLRSTRVASTLTLFLAAIATQSPVLAQTSDAHSSFENQSPEQLQKTAEAYEKFLKAPPPGKASSVQEIEARLGTVYFLEHRYRDSLNVLAKIPRATLLPQHENSSGPNAGTHFPLSAQVWLVTGLDKLEINDAAQAVPSLRHALEIQPKNATARLALGDAYARTDRMEEAAREYEVQTQQTPSQPEAWYKLGLAHSFLASAPVTQKQKGTVLLQFEAEHLLDQGRHLDAARELLRLVASAPQQPGLHADLGRALLEVGYRKAAEDQLHKELALDPVNPVAHIELAQIASLRGDWDAVRDEVLEVSQTEPRALTLILEKFPAGLVREEWVQGKMQMPDSFATSSVGGLWRTWMDESQLIKVNATASAASTAKCPADNSELLTPGLWLSEVCYNQLAEQLSNRTNLSAREKISLTEAQYRLGHFMQALTEASSILLIDPTDEWATYWLLNAHRSLANECFVKVADLDPDSVRAHQMLAQDYAAWMEFAKSKTEYKSAISIAPQQPDLHLGLGTVCWRTRDWEQAENELKIAVQLAPESAVAHYELGDTYLQQGAWQQAFDQLKSIPPDSTVIYKSTIDIAKAETELGQTDQAIQSLLSVASRDEDGQAHFLLAALYRKSGDPNRAQQALETFKQLHAASLQTNGEDEAGALEEQLGGSTN